jgi:hypothetical protein
MCFGLWIAAQQGFYVMIRDLILWGEIVVEFAQAA